MTQRVSLHVALQCEACGHTWTMEAIRPHLQDDGTVSGYFGSDYDFCPQCDTSAPTVGESLALPVEPGEHKHQFSTSGGAWSCACGATEPRIIGPGV